MQLIKKYFPEITYMQAEQFGLLNELYNYWNEKINIISRKDIEHLYSKHVLHSLAIAKFIQFKPGAKILDVGTGGGFPGIPLAIMFPESEFHLLDSIRKKINVVDDIIDKTGIVNCKTIIGRAEKIHTSYDFVVSRAVTQLPKFYNWVKSNISKKSVHEIPNGIIYLKGGDLTDELSSFQNTYSIRNISEYFDIEFFETKKVIHLFK